MGCRWPGARHEPDTECLHPGRSRAVHAHGSGPREGASGSARGDLFRKRPEARRVEEIGEQRAWKLEQPVASQLRIGLNESRAELLERPIRIVRFYDAVPIRNRLLRIQQFGIGLDHIRVGIGLVRFRFGQLRSGFRLFRVRLLRLGLVGFRFLRVRQLWQRFWRRRLRAAPSVLRRKFVEVAGFEPASLSDHLVLLRA